MFANRKPNFYTVLGIFLMLTFSCTIGKAQQCVSCPKFNHVYLSVHDIQSSLNFYTKAFGLKLTDSFSVLEITTADSSFRKYVKVVFLKFENQDFVYELAERVNKTDSLSRPGNLLQHVGIEVANIKSTLSDAITAGAKLATPIRRVKTNSGLEILQSYINGPDGEVIELTEIVTGGY